MSPPAPQPSRPFTAPARGPITLGAALLLIGTLAACVSLPPFEQLAERLPAGDFIEVGGTRLHVETFGIPGPGSPVVLVHGYGGSTFSWRKVAPQLGRDHQVVAVDLVGFGLTERPEDRTQYSRTGQVGVLSALLEHYGWSSAHFIGHSYGGGLIMSLAYLEPDKVRSLGLVASTAPIYSDQRRHFFGRQPFAELLVRLFLRPALIERSLRRSFWDDEAVTDELVSSYLERVRVAGAGRAFAGLTAPARPDERFEGLRYQELEQPTLALWGSADVLIPAEGARRSISQIPNSRFVVLDHCGHVPMEERPDEFLAEVLPFLAAIDSKPAAAAASPSR